MSRYAVDIHMQNFGAKSAVVPVNTYIFDIEDGSDISIRDIYEKVVGFIKDSMREYDSVTLEGLGIGFVIKAVGFYDEIDSDGDYYHHYYYVSNFRRLL